MDTPPTFCYYCHVKDDESLDVKHIDFVLRGTLFFTADHDDLIDHVKLKFVDSLLCEMFGTEPKVEASCTITDKGKYCQVRYDGVEHAGLVDDRVARFIEQDTPECDPTTHIEFKLHARTNGTVDLGWEDGTIWGQENSYANCKATDDIGTFEEPIQKRYHTDAKTSL